MISCTSESLPIETENLETFPFIIDEHQNVGNPVEKEWLSYSNYNLYYIGPYKDSINVDRNLSVKFYNAVLELDFDPEIDKLPPAEFEQYDNSPHNLSEYSAPAEFANLKIEVDTNQYIGNIRKTYAVFITNMDKDTAIIAYRSEIPAIMEARDKKGEWRPIQEPLKGCGFEVHSVKLPPNEMVLTSAPVFEGEFKTELRIKIGENYSNPFFGSINYGQFESAYKPNGDAK